MQCKDVMQRHSTIFTLAELIFRIHNVDIDYLVVHYTCTAVIFLDPWRIVDERC